MSNNSPVEEKIAEGNKIIAQWLNIPTKEIVVQYNESIEVNVQLTFHLDWGSLMEIVELIEDLDNGYKFQMCRKRVTIVEDEGTQAHVLTTKGATKILTVWQAVVSFINWYNSNSPKNGVS